MSDISITAANVAAGTGAVIERGTAGATITAGQVVYKDASDGKYKLADSDSATAAVRSPTGVALNGASNGQPLSILKSGPITIGGTVVAGTAYYLSSANPGGIAPLADIAAGDDPILIGLAASASVINVDVQDPNVTI